MPAPRRKERVFLDANVLYSAAYLPESGLRRLWRLGTVKLLSSSYAVGEARRNLAQDRPEALERLELLLEAVQVVDEGHDQTLPEGVRIDAKDRPTLLAAMEGRAGHLLTGDRRHFGHLFGKVIKGVAIASPAEYLRSQSRARVR